LEPKSKTPDYTILLEAADDESMRLKLPTESEDLELWDWREAGWRCLDCKVPALMDAISESQSIYDIDRFARKLAEMKPADLTKYKALLEAVGCSDLDRAELLADTLDNYLFSPRLRSPVDMAKGDLAVILPEPEAEILTPYLDLDRYGQALIQGCGGVLTSYGLIERKDGQPVQTLEQQPQRGGMEMT